MEKEGYDVTYTTDVDTDAADALQNALSPGKHKVFLSVGHDEYWSWKMRDNIEKARDRTNQPLNIGFFGANISHYQIRFAPSSSNTVPAMAPNRTIIAYKELAESVNPNWADPVISNDSSGIPEDLLDNFKATGKWRRALFFGTQCPEGMENCFKKPEDELVGVMTDVANPTGGGDFKFDDACPAWVKSMLPDPSVGFAQLLGYEADRIYPANVYPGRTMQTIGKSSFIGEGGKTLSHSVYYKVTANNARVFAAGTIQWAWGLDGAGGDGSLGNAWHPLIYSSRVEVVTRNILSCLRDGGSACGES